MPGPLSDLCVLDLSRILAGPWASQLLADLGAHVIKVEKPDGGDDTRQWGPPYWQGRLDKTQCASGYFLSANRGKQSVAIDFTHERGRALIRSLAAQADILIENFKVGGLKKYALDYASLKTLNPRLIYCSITGFGQSGPYAEQAGYDFMIQGMAGMMSITGEAQAVPGSSPQKVGVAVADVMTGMYSTVAVLAALHHRNHSGLGQHIDMALFDCQIAMLANQNMNYLVSGQAPQRLGNAHPNIVPYQTFATDDGHIIVAVGNDAQFKRLCALLGVPALSNDPLYATNAARVEQRNRLIPLLSERFKQRNAQDWLHVLHAAKIPCGSINDLQAVFDHPQTRHRQMQVEIEHPLLGSVPQVVSPIKYSDTPLEHKQAPPMLGEHTAEVLQTRLQLSEEEITQLHAEGVIACA